MFNEARLGLWLEHASCSTHLQGESPAHLYYLILPPVWISCPNFLWGDKLQQEHHFSGTQQQLLAMTAVLYLFQHLF